MTHDEEMAKLSKELVTVLAPAFIQVDPTTDEYTERYMPIGEVLEDSELWKRAFKYDARFRKFIEENH